MPALPLPALPPGIEVLIDANIIVYAIGGRSRQCEELLRRCGSAEIVGFTTIEVLNDVCHRLMLIEAAGRGLIGRPNASNLKGKPHVVRQLSAYWQHATRTASVLAVLPLDEHRFHRAQGIRISNGLMTNDSVVLAAADVFGIESLVTSDADFDGVPWITVYKPTDVI